jgi:hypothetical protein
VKTVVDRCVEKNKDVHRATSRWDLGWIGRALSGPALMAMSLQHVYFGNHNLSTVH